jgi:crossover junction endodeoxyribonuclease RuvC
MNRIIIGIDPGIADTGYGVIEADGSKLKCLDYGTIKTSANTDFSERLLSLGNSLTKILNHYQPILVSVEQLFFCKNVKTALIVGQARGVVLYTIKQLGIPLVEFTPLQIKQAVACYGQADKKQVQRMVKTILGLQELPQPDDAADALAGAICASNLRLSQPAPAKNDKKT